ncbi:hypothetical protein HI914_05290 [Erysiphe necator]|nr:hypothetical protein HI914_05290 [Erysiphe necator]
MIMWLQARVFIFGLLLSAVTGGPPEQVIQYVPTKMNADCYNRHFSHVDLSKAAVEACPRYEKRVNCRHTGSCSPGFLRSTAVTPYVGPLFKEYSSSTLLLWPLPKKGWWEKVKYHAVISFTPLSNKCAVVGAIRNTDNRNHNACRVYEVSITQSNNCSDCQGPKEPLHVTWQPIESR